MHRQVHHERVLVQQAGIITRAQALACGVSADTVRRRVRAGRWRLLYRCIYLMGGHRLTDEARVRAAWLWAQAAGAVLTGPAAAFWHGMLERAPGAVEPTLPRAAHRTAPSGVLLRRRDGWVLGHPFAGYEIDLAFPAERVAIEVGG
jgi:hypothetical protein